MVSCDFCGDEILFGETEFSCEECGSMWCCSDCAKCDGLEDGCCDICGDEDEDEDDFFEDDWDDDVE